MTKQGRKRNKSSDSNSSQPDSVNKNQGDQSAESVLTPRSLRKRINRQKEDEGDKTPTKGNSISNGEDKTDKSCSVITEETVQKLTKNESTPRTLRKRNNRQREQENEKTSTKEESMICNEEVEKSCSETQPETVTKDIDKSCHETKPETVNELDKKKIQRKVDEKGAPKILPKINATIQPNKEKLKKSFDEDSVLEKNEEQAKTENHSISEKQNKEDILQNSQEQFEEEKSPKKSDKHIKIASEMTVNEINNELVEKQKRNDEKKHDECNKNDITRKPRKSKKIIHNPSDSVVDLFNKTISICIEEEDTDDEDDKTMMKKKKLKTQDNQEKSEKITKEKEKERKTVEKKVNCNSVNTQTIISLSDDSMDADENISQDTKVDKKSDNQQDFTDAIKGKDYSNDHSIENITPSIQSDPVLQQTLTVSQHGPTDFSGQLFNKENTIPNAFHHTSPEVLDLRHASLHDEDAMAAARLMTDMAASKNLPHMTHPSIAETQVTHSGYGYCNSGDHGGLMSEHNRPNGSFQGNGHNQVAPGMWHPNMFGQPQDPYRTYDNQWDESYQNVAMYDSNNNIMNQGNSSYQSPNNSHYGNMNMPVRMMGNNTTQFENYGGPSSYPRMQQDFRPIHNLPQGMPLDYSMQIPQNPMMMMGPNTNTGMPFREVGNVSANPKRQVRKIVLLDPKHGKRDLDPDDLDSPVKRRKRSRNSQVSQESITNYDEIVKNLFVPAPPTKTVLIQPKFLNKERGNRANDIDPTQVRSISHRGLVRKYIDYLLMENEYITEISKAVSLPMENCVMDDPYLMDVIRIKIPFPTPKYMQFLKDFYPAIQVDWKALNHQLEQYRSGGEGAERFHTYYLDNRAVPVLLGEAFYFFQREGDRKTMEKAS